MQTLGEDIVLLALRQNGGFHAAPKLQLALSGSELVRLAATRRITVDAGRVTVLDPAPTGDTLLDAALADIRRGRRAPRATDWVRRPRANHFHAYLLTLAAAGAIRPERRRVLGIIPVTRWLVRDTGRLEAARARLDAVALSDQPVEPVQAALGGLVHAIGLDAALYPGHAGKVARGRLKRIAERDPAARTVGDVVATSVDASVDAAVEASIHAAVSASVHATHHAAAHHDAGGGHSGGGHH